ncbi:MAG: tetratricopeptide repeat protein [Xanthomonadales bacterium]|nr:tetratricopeptide repeat protein [Xanthomonadales bacterium]
MSLFNELKRRNVIKVAIAYLVIGWVLVQIADTALPAFGAPEWVLRVFMLMVLLGFPISLVMAWALELTPEGIRAEKTGNPSFYFLALILGIVSVYWYVSDSPIESVTAPSTTTRTLPQDNSENARVLMPSLAVIPFTNMSNDLSNEPFTVGIHDDLLTQVSKIGSIRTISRTSVLRYKDTDKSIPQIAAELGVIAVLEGGVQRVGDLVRINVQLIDAASDEHLWAETYDRELSAANIFAIQSEIAAEIARQLEVTLTPDDQRRLLAVPTDNLLALEAYFEGKLLADQRSRNSIEASILKFEQAVEYDPDFALAYSGLVYAWLLLPEYSATVDRGVSRRNSEQAAARALELDPNLPEGLTVMAWNYMAHRYDWVTAEALLRKALDESANNSDTLHWMPHVLSFQGRHAEAIKAAEKAVKSDPYSALMRMNLSYILADDRQYDEAIRFHEEALEIRPDYFEAWRNIWLSYLRAGRYANATMAIGKWAEGTGRNPSSAARLGELLEQYKRSGDAVKIPTELLDELRIGTQNKAQLYAAAGDAEATLAALSIALEERAGSRSVLSMKINPLYDFIRDDARFKKMLKEAGLAP